MSWTIRHFAVIAIILSSLLTAAGCVSVPTSGPIEPVEGQQPPCNCVNVQVKPPAPGAKPSEIVEGYLRATSNYQPNYSVAKQFLTRMSAEKWSPTDEVSIYRGKPTGTKDETKLGDQPVVVNLGGRLVGSLAKDRTYTPSNQKLSIPFRLVKEGTEWRIEDPPGGLWVEQFYFDLFYRAYELYFVGNGSLVPDLIYLPALSNPANVASALMKALLNGPSKSLKSAVTSAIPQNTTLSVDSVTITNGIAEVSLSDSVLALPDPQRSMLAAQIVYTLRQVGGVKGVLIKVNQQPFRVPGGDPNSLVISIDAIPQNMDPVPFVTGEQLYAVQSGRVKQVTATTDSMTVDPLKSQLGDGTYQVDALAVSATNVDFAFTTNRRTMLRRGLITSGQSSPLPLNGVSELLRPQISRYGEIWDIGLEGGRQRLWRFTGDGKETKPNKIELPLASGEKVTAFKISPDGTRIAFVRSIGNVSKLWLATIVRSDTITVGGWRALNTTQSNMPNMPQIRAMADVAWIDATELLVLGAADSTVALEPYRVVEDASRITGQGTGDNWKPVELAVSPRMQTAIIIGDRGQTWKYDGSQWLPFMKGPVSTIAYPG